MNKIIFDCYNDFIARVVIGSYGRASRYRSKRENCEDFGTSSRTQTQNRTVSSGLWYYWCSILESLFGLSVLELSSGAATDSFLIIFVLFSASYVILLRATPVLEVG